MNKIFKISLVICVTSWIVYFSIGDAAFITISKDKLSGLELDHEVGWKRLAAITGVITAVTAFMTKLFEIIKYFIEKKYNDKEK